MELELKHLAPYLPYGLKIHKDNNNKDNNNYWIMTMWEGSPITKDIYIHISTIFIRDNIFKPILRPLSDLIKSITIDEETFIPLIELNSIRGVETEAAKYQVWDDGPGFDMWHCTWAPDYQLSFEKQTMSFYTKSPYNCNDISPQLDMFQKLFEWQFDVFGLIDAGLAIDINTLTDGTEKTV